MQTLKFSTTTILWIADSESQGRMLFLRDAISAGLDVVAMIEDIDFLITHHYTLIHDAKTDVMRLLYKAQQSKLTPLREEVIFVKWQKETPPPCNTEVRCLQGAVTGTYYWVIEERDGKRTLQGLIASPACTLAVRKMYRPGITRNVDEFANKTEAEDEIVKLQNLKNKSI